VLLSRRDSRCGALAARVSTAALLHPSFRVHFVDNEAVIAEDALALRAFDRKGRLGRPAITILLEGRARIRALGEERWMSAGDVALLPSKSGVEMRQEALPRYSAIVVEWDPGTWLGDRPERFEVRTAPALDRIDPRDVWGAVDAIERALLDGAFVSRGTPPDRSPASEPHIRVSAALDRALSDLDAQPMSADLERTLGMSARHVARLVAAFNETYGFNAGTWRDARNRRRILVAAALLSHADATLEIVARAVGYRSPSALCRAFADVSFPPPAKVRETIAALG
jgi:AraC-like DNA-binding protein